MAPSSPSLTETRTPRVSLLVAMRNEEAHIERCLRSILTQDYPAHCLEVWVLDGRSSDRSWSIAEGLVAGRAGWHLMRNPNITQAAAWNLGLARATGDVIGIVSGHAELAPDYVTSAVETLQRTGADMVGGPMRALGDGQVGAAIAVATSTPFGVGGARFHYTRREEEVDTVYMGLSPRRVYKRIGSFDEEFVRNQDDELSYRLLGSGGRIVCNPAIRSIYYSRPTLRSLWRQYFEYGFWKVRVMQKHPRQMRVRQFVPASFVASLLLLTALAPTGSAPRAVLAAVAGLYIAVNLAASIWAAMRHGSRHLPYLPVVFTILHVAYGVGFLLGLARFAIPWSRP